MARIAYGDLHLNWSPGATDIPTQTQIGDAITTYYEQCYEKAYGVGNYPSDDTDDDDSDPKTIIRAKEFEGKLKAEISKKIQKWHDSGMNSDGQVITMPDFNLSPKLEKMIDRMSGKQHDLIESIRVYGSDYDDMGVI